MRHKSGTRGSGSEQLFRTIKRKTRRQYSAEENIRVVLDSLRGEDNISELCSREGLSESMYYKWSKEFMEVGKKHLSGNIVREASTDEVKGLRREARGLKECVVNLTLENRLLKKTV